MADFDPSLEPVSGPSHVRAVLLARALGNPRALSQADGEAAAELLTAARSDEEQAHALCVLAALAYGRPGILPSRCVEALAAWLGGSAEAAARAARGLRLLIATPLAAAVEAWACAAVPRLDRGALARDGGELLELLALGVEQRGTPGWCTAAEPLLAVRALRDGTIGRILEPTLFRERRELTVERLTALDRRLHGSSRWSWTLATLATRPEVPAAARAFAEARSADDFPERAGARPLREEPFRLLILMNVRIGLGDELVRVGALLDALLTANPRARATVLTPRPFLYDHPRVEAIALGDPQAESVLRDATDGLFVIHESAAPLSVIRPELEEVARAVEERPFLLLRGDVGRGEFLFRRVRLGCEELAFRRALDRTLLASVYDPTRRLLLELGLPVTVGGVAARRGGPFATSPSADAEAALATLVPAGRPLAVVQPFGGAHALKGYLPEQAREVATGLERLVAEGFRVVLLPNGQPWTGAEAVAAILERLDPDVRSEVVLGPDPARPEPGIERERPELAWADRAMRIQKFLVARADLVVGVEGWIGHAAYHLGRAFRLLLRTDSEGSRWYPPLRDAEQTIAQDLPLDGAPLGSDALDGGIVAPSRARRSMLIEALSGLEALAPAEAIALLRRAVGSPAEPIRAPALRLLAAAADLGGVRDTVLADLQPHLGDRRAGVRGAAAEALLALDREDLPGLGPDPRARLLALAAIGRQQWQTALALGAAAVPAILCALEDENPILRNEARWALGVALGPTATRLRAGRHPS